MSTNVTAQGEIILDKSLDDFLFSRKAILDGYTSQIENLRKEFAAGLETEATVLFSLPFEATLFRGKTERIAAKNGNQTVYGIFALTKIEIHYSESFTAKELKPQRHFLTVCTYIQKGEGRTDQGQEFTLTGNLEKPGFADYFTRWGEYCFQDEPEYFSFKEIITRLQEQLSLTVNN